MQENKIIIAGAGPVGSCSPSTYPNAATRFNCLNAGPTCAKKHLRRPLDQPRFERRGIKALEEGPRWKRSARSGIPMHGRYPHNADGTTAFQPYGRKDSSSIRFRGELNKKLMDWPEHHGAEIHFSEMCKAYRLAEGEIHFENALNHKVQTVVPSTLFFGSDGALFSCQAHPPAPARSLPVPAQYYIDFGYKELCIPPADNEAFNRKEACISGHAAITC